jgi:hypothetical protein
MLLPLINMIGLRFANGRFFANGGASAQCCLVKPTEEIGHAGSH